MEVTLVLAAGGVAAGIFGALLGLGGGLLIVPLLSLGLGLPVREAVGVSLICVIMTSSAAASVYLQRHVANLRLGMVLELFSAGGAVAGGFIAFLLPESVVAGLFAVFLTYTALSMLRARDAGSLPGGGDDTLVPADLQAEAPRAAVLSGPDYTTRRLGLGVGGSVVAGLLSALLGVGGGIVKVPLMHLAMGVPLRVATATSNLMIGITACASAVVYLLRDSVDPLVAGPTAIGVFVGATIGSRGAQRVDVRVLRVVFVVVLLYTAVEMAHRALG